MPEEKIFYTEEIHERVALYITEHGGKIQTERVDPAWVFHKVTFAYTFSVCIGIGESPIYRYTLANGGMVLVQLLYSKGTVPGHPDDYWAVLYVQKDGSNGKSTTAHATA